MEDSLTKINRLPFKRAELKSLSSRMQRAPHFKDHDRVLTALMEDEAKNSTEIASLHTSLQKVVQKRRVVHAVFTALPLEPDRLTSASILYVGSSRERTSFFMRFRKRRKLRSMQKCPLIATNDNCCKLV